MRIARDTIFKKIFYSKILRIILIIILLLVLYNQTLFLSLLIFPIPQKINSDFSECFYYSDNSTAWITLNSEDQYRIECNIDEVSQYLKKGIVYYEDKYFFFHNGINPVSIIRAIYLLIRYKKIVSGGSTITMQLSRLVEPKKRTIGNKILELLRALQIEFRYSKKQILEKYLNIVPMGGIIQGIAAASQLYFNKSPSQLTFVESCLLISISNSPNTNRPDKNPEIAFDSRNKAAHRISHLFNINSVELEKMLNKSIKINIKSFDSNIIPLVEKYNNSPYVGSRVLSIDKKIQNTANYILLDSLNRINVNNGAVIIVENSDMKLRSYIGAPFYNQNRNASRINSANTPRSPGSTLKPFIYIRALEEGIITPQKKLFDIPYDFYGYKPKNFSNMYYGVISSEEALYRSLNIPAIFLENILKEKGLKTILYNSNIISSTNFLDKNDLSIVLGSYPLTLEEITTLYCSIANQGEFRELSFINDDKLSPGKRIFSTEASFIISDILAKGFRPDLYQSWEFTKDKPKCAFKTGTSYGFVDGWCMGYTPKYTVGVWVGNLDNKYTKNIIGISVSAPILFKIINVLEKNNDEWFKKPENVKSREVCALSGMVAGEFCKNKITDYYIKDVTSFEKCNVHKRVFVEENTGKAYSLDKLEEDKNYKEKIVEIWDNEVQTFLEKYGKNSVTGLYGDIDYLLPTQKLKIISPARNVKYIINKSLDNMDSIPLISNSLLDTTQVYWYANNSLIATVKKGDIIYYKPMEQKIKFDAVDDKLRSDSVIINFSFEE